VTEPTRDCAPCSSAKGAHEGMSALPVARQEVRRDLIVLLVAAGLLFTLALGARDLWNPNEPVYGQAVSEMLDSGDWLMPTVNGVPFAEKPILYFWLAAASALLFGGPGEFALRLPLALSSALSVGFVYLLIHPYGGRARARLGAALYATTYLVFWSARSIQMDSLVGWTTLGAVLAVCRVLDRRLRAEWGFLLAGIAVGVGLLAKGPVGLICPLLVLSAYVTLQRRWADVRPLPLLLAALAALLVASPWYVALALRGDAALLYELIVRQNFARFVDPWDHQAPFWYYLVYFWSDMAPWAFFVPLAWKLPDREPDERRLDRLAWCWILAVLVFFSLSASKRSAYLLPLAPAVAILVSGVGHQLLEGRLSTPRRRAVWAVFGFWGVVLLASAAAVQFAIADYPLVRRPATAAALLLLAGGVAVFTGLVSRWKSEVVPAAFASLALSLYLLTGCWLLPAVDVYKSARPFARDVLEQTAGEQPVRIYGDWRWRASYSYYTGRRLERLETPQELRRYWDSAPTVFVIVERAALAELQATLGQVPIRAERAIGSKRVYLVSNRAL